MAAAEVRHRTVEVASGVRLHVAEAGPEDGPAVLLVHGFPELWYSWRHQMRALAARGFRAVAPDLRGYGDSDAPPGRDSYTVLHLVGDLVALIADVGQPRVFVAAHDWGAAVAWQLCLLRPDLVTAFVALSVEYHPRNPTRSPVQTLRAVCGDGHYICFFQKPGVAEAEFGRSDIKCLLKKFYGMRKAAPLIIPPGKTLFDSIDSDGTCPAWLSEEDISYYAEKFEKTGFTGGLNYYRCIDLNWELTAPWTGVPIKVPTKFIVGDQDLTYNIPGVKDHIHKGGLKACVPNLEDVVVMEGVAHFINQEKPDEVSDHICGFFSKFRPARAATKAEQAEDGLDFQTLAAARADRSIDRGGALYEMAAAAVRHREVEVASGVRLHVAESGPEGGPVALLVHGFPELWYSWRHQMRALAARGFRAVAPDLRGYGDSDAPQGRDSYTVLHLVGDLVALIADLGRPQGDLVGALKVFVAGHDWGAVVAWQLCLLRPDLVTAHVSLSVEYQPRHPRMSVLQAVRVLCGDDHYVCRFQKPGVAEAEFARLDLNHLFKMVFGMRKPATIILPQDKTFFDAIDSDGTCPPWLSEEDISYYADKFGKTGFTGGFNYYRCIDLDWELTAPWTGALINVPTKFIVGDLDLTYNTPGVKDYIHKGGFKANVPNLEDVVVLEGVGHFINQEKPDEVSEHICEFFSKFLM
ncbi:uncharacterized protein LOC127759904 [Oryza glaberrima]|nr:uncharacterized protein LOC127759904 [Oryza glaberrima]